MIEIQERINSMSLEELKQQLAAYMAADPHFAPRPTAVEVRLSNDSHARCRYDVLLITENGEETEVKFSDRYSRLIYIYTLLHPLGYQRRLAAANDYRVLRNLYYALYVKDNEALIKTIESTGFDHFCNHYIALSRKAIRKATLHYTDFAIDRPQSHGGKTLIPFVHQGGAVLLDETLRNTMSYKL